MALYVFLMLHGAVSVRAQEPLLDHAEYALQANRPVELGSAVRVDGDWAIALARLESSVSGAMGALFVYRRTTAGWVRHSVLRPHPRDTTIFGEAGGFGEFESIAIRGNRIAVGDRRWRSSQNDGPKGIVYVYCFDGVEWVLTQRLVAPDFKVFSPLENAYGASVTWTKYGELLVGAPADEYWLPAPSSQGAYYVYATDVDGDLRYEYKLGPPVASMSDEWYRMGPYTAISDDTIVYTSNVGFPFGAPLQALTFGVMERNSSGVWSVVDHLEAPPTSVPQVYTIDIDGDFCVVGDRNAFACSSLGGGFGRVHVWKRNAGAWTYIQEIRSFSPFAVPAPNGLCAVFDTFGASVDIRGDRLAVGAFEAGHLVPGRNGSVETFRFDGAQFQREYLIQYDPPPTPGLHPTTALRPQFGEGLALTDHGVIVGMPTSAEPIANGSLDLWYGGVQFYDFPQGDTVCSGQPNFMATPATLTMAGDPSVGGSGHFYGVVHDLPAFTACLPLVGPTPGFTPGFGGGQGNLCIGAGFARIVSQLGTAAPDRTFRFDVDLQAIPSSAGLVSIAAGERWTFQVWYRDFTAQGSTSNLSSAVEVEFVE